MTDVRSDLALRPGQVMGWTLLAALAGAVVSAFLFFAWSEWSGAGQDLGFIRVMLDFAIAGGSVGAIAALLFALSR